MHSLINERCDIIIPVWNHLKETRDCIRSIQKHTNYPYRIIVVDNASDDITRRYLDGVKENCGDSIEIIRNEENKGFVKAVNQGMRFSDALYLCIMNNDTIATEGWLSEMIDILLENSDIGIINPSSNTSCQFPGRLDIDTFAKTLKRFKGEYQELYACRAFSMVVKRAVVVKAGYLDDAYGMGYFDDTDYCKRAQQLGYKTVRAKASYVYHKESRSFSEICRKNDIFTENEKKFIKKWGSQLRVAYILSNLGSSFEAERVSGNINKIAKTGHQVWIFTAHKFKFRLNLIDHENIRFYCYPKLIFAPVVLYKIWKRKRKKRLHIVLTNNKRFFYLFDLFRSALDASVYPDRDSRHIEKILQEKAYSPVSI